MNLCVRSIDRGIAHMYIHVSIYLSDTHTHTHTIDIDRHVLDRRRERTAVLSISMVCAIDGGSLPRCYLYQWCVCVSKHVYLYQWCARSTEGAYHGARRRRPASCASCPRPSAHMRAGSRGSRPERSAQTTAPVRACVRACVHICAHVQRRRLWQISYAGARSAHAPARNQRRLYACTSTRKRA